MNAQLITPNNIDQIFYLLLSVVVSCGSCLPLFECVYMQDPILFMGVKC